MVCPKGVKLTDAELGKFTTRFSPGSTIIFAPIILGKKLPQMLLGDGSPQAQCVAHIYNENFQKADDGLSLLLSFVFSQRYIH